MMKLTQEELGTLRAAHLRDLAQGATRQICALQPPAIADEMYKDYGDEIKEIVQDACNDALEMWARPDTETT